MPPVLLAVLLLALTAPAAAAQPVVDVDVAPDEARFGQATRVAGTVLDGGAPVAGAGVRLEGTRYPFERDFRTLDEAVTGEDGSFAFRREFERNWRVRVTAGEATSEVARVYVFPRVKLRFRARNERVLRLVQRYRVPHGVKLGRPTHFYVGRAGARRGRRAASAKVERTASGRFRSVAVVRIPARWQGRFRYASCFRYTPGSGMGDPRSTCPRRFRF